MKGMQQHHVLHSLFFTYKSTGLIRANAFFRALKEFYSPSRRWASAKWLFCKLDRAWIQLDVSERETTTPSYGRLQQAKWSRWNQSQGSHSGTSRGQSVQNVAIWGSHFALRTPSGLRMAPEVRDIAGRQHQRCQLTGADSFSFSSL